MLLFLSSSWTMFATRRILQKIKVLRLDLSCSSFSLLGITNFICMYQAKVHKTNDQLLLFPVSINMLM